MQITTSLRLTNTLKPKNPKCLLARMQNNGNPHSTGGSTNCVMATLEKPALPDDLQIGILYNPAVLHLGSIPREIHTTMFQDTNACLQQR